MPESPPSGPPSRSQMITGGRTEGRELARWQCSAVGLGATVTAAVSRGVALRQVPGRGAPFPAPARQTVRAVLPHTAYRRRSPPAFGVTRQARKGLGAATVPSRLIRPSWLAEA